jgi:hypothetical protein
MEVSSLEKHVTKWKIFQQANVTGGYACDGLGQKPSASIGCFCHPNHVAVA